MPDVTAAKVKLALDNLEACQKALKWVGRHPEMTWQQLWAACPRGDWLVWVITRVYQRARVRKELTGVIASLRAMLSYSHSCRPKVLKTFADVVRAKCKCPSYAQLKRARNW